MKIIALTYGDPSCDGHGMSDTDYYESSHSTSQIHKAMLAAQKALNFNWDCVCQEYGDCSLSEEQYNLFKSVIDVDSYVEDDGGHVHDFTGLYLALAKTQLPDLVTKFMQITTDSRDIGGYGLFEN